MFSSALVMWGVGEHDRIGDRYLPPRFLCQSACFLSRTTSSADVRFHSHFTKFHLLAVLYVVEFIYQSASGPGQTNGNIPQQLSPWQQDETCCVAYFLSANLQLPSKPLPFRQTGPFSFEADQFDIISSYLYFPTFLANVTQLFYCQTLFLVLTWNLSV